MKKAIVLIAMFISMFSSSWAANSNPCASDVETLCSGERPDRIARCFRKHEAAISPACQEKRIEMRQELLAAADACEIDVIQLCSEAPSGKGNLLECLTHNLDGVSKNCKAAIRSLQKKSASN